MYTFCNASYNITVFHLHFKVYNKYTLNSDNLSHIGQQENFTGMADGPFSHLNRRRLFVSLVVENNATRLREIKSAIIEDFENIQTVSISTIDRVLERHQINLNQLDSYIWKKWWKSEGAALPVCPDKTCMSMQQLYLTVKSTKSYSDIQYSKCNLYTFAMAVVKKMQYVLYTFDVTVSWPKWKCM